MRKPQEQLKGGKGAGVYIHTYLKIVNETIRAPQESLATTSMRLGQDPGNYIDELI